MPLHTFQEKTGAHASLLQGIWVKVEPSRIDQSLEKPIELKVEVGKNDPLPTSYFSSTHILQVGTYPTLPPHDQGVGDWGRGSDLIIARGRSEGVHGCLTGNSVLLTFSYKTGSNQLQE